MNAMRRWFGAVTLALAGALLASCAATTSPVAYPPIVFVHGNGDSAALWQTTLWRFESNGWPKDRLRAIDVPYPLARDVDSQSQPGRSSSSDNADVLKREVEKVLQATGADKVVLVGNSRGGYAIRNYLQNGDAAARVSHAVLGGTPNHGVWAIKGFREDNEFSGTGPFLTRLNSPKNAAGDEVTGPVKWLTLRSDNNDKFAQPDGLWTGAKGTPTNVGFDGPALKGATNIVLSGADHRELSFSPAAFAATYQFITGKLPATNAVVAQTSVVLNGKVMGLGLNPVDVTTGNFVNNLPLPGALLTVYVSNPATGARVGAAAHTQTIGADGLWGPFSTRPDASHEFVLQAAGYATTHTYRSPFARSSNVVHLRAERLADADKAAGASITMTRPRGYFDAQRDRMVFDGQTTLPGVPAQGAGVSSSKILMPLSTGPVVVRSITAQFNGESITGLTWPVQDGGTTRVVVLELTY